jgi:hypothetical protein
MHQRDPLRRISPDAIHYRNAGDRSLMKKSIADPIEFARVRLLAKNFDKSWKFYRDVLGLTPANGHGSPLR